MEQRISLITLGVPDMEVATSFYEALGWQRAQSPDGVVAFDLISQTLGLYPIEKLAEDIGLPVEALGTGAMTLSHNTRSAEEVDVLMEAARAAGAEVLRPAGEVFWGGYIGYFRAPDGHIWEIAHNPFSPLSEDGAFRWNGFPEAD
ncbi:glyoxalase [Phaeobacter gallaeciensis]|uniref:Glyoxalase n=1 Tax=Phaeobacter gallaeciensis TaxID=60890 RepID=A0A1B0ZN81_9RHOB|nr:MULTISPECIES: VOC family protein [Phaeobacter]ANP35605.1 glyoxalase [Phaeobacter gallaeciensis]MDE4061287.1 VOC family protein [Phaeobacter gallaeciensis]MDE4124306.1 VOC family protein [Phaeobacter gallaeciensis]MDE4128838.1 VOC family protein [Phaeobacter gallaeciensis]MDE4303287.1 VOC family protein [Phaeobacter gallaeciensis]